MEAEDRCIGKIRNSIRKLPLPWFFHCDLSQLYKSFIEKVSLFRWRILRDLSQPRGTFIKELYLNKWIILIFFILRFCGSDISLWFSLYIGFGSFLDSSFHEEYNTLFAVWATLYIPIFMRFYPQNIKTSDWTYINKQTHLIKRIIMFIFLILLSQHYFEPEPSIFYLSCVIIYLFWMAGEDVIFLLFHKDRRREWVLGRIFKKYNEDKTNHRKKYVKVKERVRKEIKRKGLLIDENAQIEYGYRWPIFMDRNPINVNINTLGKWITKLEKNNFQKNDMESRIRSYTQTSGNTPSSLTKGFLNKSKPFLISISDKNEYLTFYVHSDKKKIEPYINGLEKCFSFPLEDKRISEIWKCLDNIDVSLLSKIEGGHFVQFQTEIQTIESIIESLKTYDNSNHRSDPDLQNDILQRIVAKIHNFIESTDKVKEYQLCKDLLFNLWRTLLRISLGVNKNSDCVYFFFHFLSATFQRGIFEEDQKDYFEQRLTFILKYETPITKAFFMNYIRALARVAYENSKKDSQNQSLKDLDIFFIKLIRNLQEDIKEKLVLRDSEDIRKEVLEYTRQALMFLGALYIENKKESQFKTTLCGYIDISSFLSTLASLNRIDTYWRHGSSMWSNIHFDRHGHSGIRMTSSSSFYIAFISQFFSIASEGVLNEINVEKDCENLEHGQLSVLQYQLSEAKKDFENLNKKDPNDSKKQNIDDIKKKHEIIEELIKELQKSKDGKIIDGSLSQQRVEQFIDRFKEGYEKCATFSELLKAKPVKMNKDEFYGINEAYPREYFLEVNQSVSGLKNIGWQLAYSENKKIFEGIESQCKSENINVDKFSKDILSKWINEEGYIITNDSDERYRIFSWDGKCQNNPSLIKEYVDGSYGKYSLLKQNGKEIKIHLLAWNPREHRRFYMFVGEGHGIQIERKINPEKEQEKSSKNGDETNEKEVFKNWKDLFAYNITDLASDENGNLRKEIIQGGKYFKEGDIKAEDQDRHLKLHVGVQLYIAPHLSKIENPNQIEIYWIKD